MKGSAIYCNDFETAVQLIHQGKVNLKWKNWKRNLRFFQDHNLGITHSI